MTSGLDGLSATAADDPQALLAALVDGVGRALPASIASSVWEVERTRSLGDRLAGRPGTIAQVTLTRDGESMTLKLDNHDRLVGEARRVAGGVVISRRTLALGEWLSVFAGEVGAIAADAAGDAANAARALVALGVQPAGTDVVVTEADIDGGLQALPSRLLGRIPEEARAIVVRTTELLRETLPRVVGGGETEVLVERTATVYLPDTLRAYLALPATWADQHVLANGLTAAQALVGQLEALETATRRMHDAAVEQDARELLVNGQFLADRFARPSLELPPAGV